MSLRLLPWKPVGPHHSAASAAKFLRKKESFVTIPPPQKALKVEVCSNRTVFKNHTKGLISQKEKHSNSWNVVSSNWGNLGNLGSRSRIVGLLKEGEQRGWLCSFSKNNQDVSRIRRGFTKEGKRKCFSVCLSFLWTRPHLVWKVAMLWPSSTPPLSRSFFACLLSWPIYPPSSFCIDTWKDTSLLLVPRPWNTQCCDLK